jgi:hypothetical protein
VKRYPRETLSWLGGRWEWPQHSKVLPQRARTDTSKLGSAAIPADIEP